MALATTIRSPNNWVTSLAQTVSTQPPQAPENSSSGWASWLPLTAEEVPEVVLDGRRSWHNPSWTPALPRVRRAASPGPSPWPGRFRHRLRSPCSPARSPGSGSPGHADPCPPRAWFQIRPGPWPAPPRSVGTGLMAAWGQTKEQRAALDAVLPDPVGHKVRHAPLLVPGGAHREAAVFPALESADRKPVSFQAAHDPEHAGDKLGNLPGARLRREAVSSTASAQDVGTATGVIDSMPLSTAA